LAAAWALILLPRTQLSTAARCGSQGAGGSRKRAARNGSAAASDVRGQLLLMLRTQHTLGMSPKV